MSAEKTPGFQVTPINLIDEKLAARADSLVRIITKMALTPPQFAPEQETKKWIVAVMTMGIEAMMQHTSEFTQVNVNMQQMERNVVAVSEIIDTCSQAIHNIRKEGLPLPLLVSKIEMEIHFATHNIVSLIKN